MDLLPQLGNSDWGPGWVTTLFLGHSVSALQSAVPRLTLASSTFCWKKISSSFDSRRASCQLLVKEYAMNTGKLLLGGLPRNSVVK